MTSSTLIRSRSTSATTSLHDAGAHDGVQRGEGLVHQNKLRPHRQHLRQRYALALPAAEMPRIPVAEACEAEPVEPGFRLG